MVGGGCPLAGEQHPAVRAAHHRCWTVTAVIGLELPLGSRHELAAGLAAHAVGENHPEHGRLPAVEQLQHPTLGWAVSQVSVLLPAPSALAAVTIVHDHLAEAWPDAQIREIHLAGEATQAWDMTLRRPGH